MEKIFEDEEKDQKFTQLKEMIREHRIERLQEFIQFQSEISKNNIFAPPQLTMLSELAQNRLSEIQNRSGKKLISPITGSSTSVLEKLQNYDNLERQLELMKYIKRVNEAAAEKLLDDREFADKFMNESNFNAVILSVDIRRSTELMLRCSSPKIYSEFITELNGQFQSAIKNRFGVYDKFTGDGILAFFPEFYSGEDALAHAILCAKDCADIFDTIFDEYKNEFNLGEVKTGIGAGIDFGQVYAEVGAVEYSVVGKPVVYACRFSSAPAGHIFLTEEAKNQLEKINGGRFKYAETSVAIKHESDMKAYDVFLWDENACGKLPHWAV